MPNGSALFDPLMGAAMHGQGRSPRAYQRLQSRGPSMCLSCAGRETKDEAARGCGSMNALAQTIVDDLASACWCFPVRHRMLCWQGRGSQPLNTVGIGCCDDAITSRGCSEEKEEKGIEAAKSGNHRPTRASRWIGRNVTYSWLKEVYIQCGVYSLSGKQFRMHGGKQETMGGDDGVGVAVVALRAWVW
ncbi:hypothetical protein LX36DRAFT_651986 [Colletotrichum falcatum]|nr:hypothetical protein LX36DRAFT_651986 [Colletotrichum falcatum]